MNKITHHTDFTSKRLQVISEEFSDEIERRPTIHELMEILTWGLKSCHDDVILDVHPANIIALEAKIKIGTQPKNLSLSKEDKGIDDLNDSVFVEAVSFFSNLAKAIMEDTGKPPALSDLCDLLVKGLSQCEDDLLADISPIHIEIIKANILKRGKIVTTTGDIVAIPARGDEYFIAIILAKNCFGTAYGFFEGTRPLKKVSTFSYLIPKGRPIYTGDHLVASGRWKIIGHDEKLRSFFSKDPEIYHEPQFLEGVPNIGPYGSGETANGRLRHLSKAEAEEIGLLSGEYRQTYLEEELEDYLRKTL